MRYISTGEPSNLKTYRNIALILSGNEESDAVKFFDKKIEEDPEGERAEVIQHESQMLYLITKLVSSERRSKKCGDSL